MTSSGSKRPIRGRRRFTADLLDATELCDTGFDLHGLQIRNLKGGDEEGCIVCDVVQSSGQQLIVSLSLLVSDTSDYPETHSYFCYSTGDEHVPPSLSEVIENVHEQRPRTIEDMMKWLLNAFANKLSSSNKRPRLDDSDEEMGASDDAESEQEIDSDPESFDEHYDDDDDDFGMITSSSPGDVDVSVLHREFLEIISLGYRPGLTKLGCEELVLSVSMPSFRLAESIPTQALMAWDARLLSATRHLTLTISRIRGVYPILLPDGRLNSIAATRMQKLSFRVGLTPKYKPDKELATELVRTFGLKQEEEIPEHVQPRFVTDPAYDSDHDSLDDTPEDHFDYQTGQWVTPADKPSNKEDQFGFSLSSSLEALLNDRFLELLQLRLKYGFGWAAAEAVSSEVHRAQRQPEDIVAISWDKLVQADASERELALSNKLPHDPLSDRQDGHLNLPLLVFTYLLRRLTLCSRFCLVCFDKIDTDFQALKPYVCNDKLCEYQYYNLNRGPSLEYEIQARPQTVDLLVSLTYCAAAEDGLKDFPVGMNMQVPQQGNPQVLEDFDSLHERYKCRVIMDLLDSLPPVLDMKKHLERKVTNGRAKPTLRGIDPAILPAAWLLLRWCVASCTAHLEELTAPEDRLIGVEPKFRQYRFTVGAPDAEAKFHAAQQEACAQDAHARQYPSLYAFHGSSTKNWHSIIRHGLWFKDVVNGRAYGHGVYFAKDGNVSLATYSRAATAAWKKSAIQVTNCAAVAEIVNLPSQFVSSNPYFVVAQTHWIMCRYLLVSSCEGDANLPTNQAEPPSIELDPSHPLTIGTRPVKIPQTAYRLERLLEDRKKEYVNEDYDDEDKEILAYGDLATNSQASAVEAPVSRPADDWVHDPAWVEACVQHMLPPPVDASPMATSSLQRELVAMLKEQDSAKSLKELGWYMPPDFIGDNLFQWIVEMHSFDPELPIAQDLKARNVNSLVFEIRFPPTFPHAPPFFRILKPRFLPFIHGGGGHVTGGGSMCMDLLTSDGWLPSYSIAAVMLQIKLAISNLEPRPARLAQDWDRPYAMDEAVAGYKRAAQTHGWKIPASVDTLTT